MLNELLEGLESGKPKPFSYNKGTESKNIHTVSGRKKIYARFAGAEQLPNSLDAFDVIYLPLETDIETFRSLAKTGKRIGADMPRGMFGQEDNVRKKLSEVKDAGINIAFAGNLGSVKIAKDLGMEIHAGLGLNIYNTESIFAAEKLGIGEILLSFELSLIQAKKLGGDIPRGLLAYGSLPLMLTRNCPVARGLKCSECRRENGLTDRMGIYFPVRCRWGCSEIFNSRPVYMADRLNEIENADFILLYFTVENKRQCGEIINDFLTETKPQGEFTRGLYYKGLL